MMPAVSCSGLTVSFSRNSGTRSSGTTVHFYKNKQVLAIILILVINKCFKNLFQNIVAGFLGFALVVLPFAIYFYAKGALYDMLYGTILYNIKYATGSYWEVSIAQVLQRMRWTWPCWGYLVVTVIGKKRDIVLYIIHAISAICCMMIVLSGNSFGHYSIICAVFIPLFFNALREYNIDTECTLNWKPLFIMLCVLAVVPAVSKGVNRLNILIREDGESSYAISAKEIIAEINYDDRDEIIGYNTDSLFYLYTDIVPCYKYYTLQDWQSGKSNEMTEENVEFYKSKIAKWVIVADAIKNEPIRSAINDNYSLVKKVSYSDEELEHELLLYQRNV